ncbi:NFATC2-interacting protein isoform X2 [Lampris incognitus]|uniref:NFATC2-interacting protein isoform X2 n=1 Tax=Lampris incognitus TaxID=2546036 RepID=UPI0024B4ABAC|nr:NFATC2-interacting protein isoform X2 [Lampris incognitus]
MADVVIISDSDSDEELVPVKPPPKHHRIIDPSAIASVPIYSSKIINDSDNDEEIIPRKPPLKRRRIIDPSSIASVPIYSNKVNTCLQLKATAPVVAGNDTADSAEVRSQYKLLSPKKKSACQLLILTDSEEEVEYVAEERNKELEKVHSPSPPPPPGSPPAKVSKHVSQKIREINKKLGAVCALLSQSAESGGVRHSRRNQSLPVLDEHDDDIIISPNTSPKGPPTESERNSMPDREIPLKFRCRTDLHKIPLFSSAPLSEAVNELSRKLNVQPFRILLLRNEMELPTHLTANELGLSIADIIGQRKRLQTGILPTQRGTSGLYPLPVSFRFVQNHQAQGAVSL